MLLQRSGGDHLQLWIFGFDRLIELRIASFVAPRAIEFVFVANLDIFHSKRSRMAVFRPYHSPFRGCSPSRKLDLLKGIVDKRSQFRSWANMIAF